MGIPAYEDTEPVNQTATPSQTMDVPKYEETEPISVGHNAWEDVKGIGKGLMALPGAVNDTLSGMAFHQKDFEETPIGGALNNALPHKENGDWVPGSVYERGKEIVSHPIQSFKEHPVKTPLDILSVLDPAMKAGGAISDLAHVGEVEGPSNLAYATGNAAEHFNPAKMSFESGNGAEDLNDIAPLKQAGPKLGPPPEKLSSPSEIPQGPVDQKPPWVKPEPPPSESGQTPGPVDPLEAVKDYLTKQYGDKVIKPGIDPTEAVKDYLTKQFGDIADKQHFESVVPTYLRRMAQNMSLKNMGATPGQARQIPMEAIQKLGQYGINKGITDPLVGSIGMEEKVNQIHQIAGNAVGQLRKLADTRGTPAPNIVDIKNAVKSVLDQKYTAGIESGQAGTYAKALEELERTPATHEGLAELSTRLNKSATDAKRLQQNGGAITDVANVVSRINNASIAKMLKGPELKAYESALEDFGATSKIKQFLKYKASKELTGRMGPGSFARDTVQKFLDTFGYKALSRISSKMADVLEKDPSKAKNLPAIFKEFINQADDIGSDLKE